MLPDEHQTDPRPLLLSALLVVTLGTGLLDPSRLVLLLVPLSLLMAAHGAGLRLDRAFGPLLPPDVRTRPTLALATDLATGTAVLGLIVELSGMAGYYQWAGIAVIGFGLYSAIQTVRTVRTVRPVTLCPDTLVAFGQGIAVGGIWLTAWLWATIPPVFYDELAYHLPIPQYALRTGSLPAFSWSYFTFMPHVSDLLLGWGLFLQGDLGARAAHMASWIAAWIALWAFAETALFPRRHPWLGFALACALASSPTFLFLGTLPFAESALSLAVIGAGALLISSGSGPSPWLAVGLLWGLAAGVKLSGPLWIMAETAAALALGWSARHLLLAWFVMIGTASPWWVRAWMLTGDPVYPLGYRLFGGHLWDEASQAKLRGDLPSIGTSPTLTDLLRLPYDMVVAPEHFGSASDAGIPAVAGVCLALVLPILVYLSTENHTARRRSLAACLFVTVAGAGWVATSTTTRFFAPALLVGSALLPLLLSRVRQPIQAAGLVGLTLLGIWGLTRFVTEHDEVFHSRQVALGQESREAYLARMVDHAESARYVRDRIPPDASILFIGETRPYYFDRPALAPYPIHEHPLAQWVREAASPEQLRNRIREEGITHVVLNTGEFRRVHDLYKVLDFSGPEEQVLDLRLKELPRLLTLLFVKHNVYVFQVPSGG
ncbi:MAG: hypothetical protein GDA68_07830 [Nitrospira sp. CR2.1]|nr:hypothetical protein [Nitrospira sp. CR2.1]